MLKFFNPIFLVKYLYAKFYVWFTFFLMNWATKRVRKLMFKIGKNPDFVQRPPPPPPKYDDRDIDRAWIVDSKVRGPAWLAVVDHYDTYVKRPEEHPILRLRAAWEEKQKKAAQAALAPTITEVGGDAIDSLREAVSKVEETVKTEEPEKKE